MMKTHLITVSTELSTLRPHTSASTLLFMVL